MVLATANDTLAPYGTIRISLSDPLADSQNITFLFTPAFYSFYTTVNNTRDTLTITCTSPLMGDTRHTIRTSSVVTSESGGVISPDNDSLTFYTGHREEEPNGVAAAADTLVSALYGSIETVHDSDLIVLPVKTRMLHYAVWNAAATLIYRGTVYTPQSSDSIYFPDTTQFPLLLTVCSHHKSTGGYYKLSTTKW